MRKRKNGQELLKDGSRRQILLSLRTQGPLSKAQLTGITSLSRTCVCDTCNELIKEGLLVEAGTVTGPRGRPMVLLRVNPDGPMAAGIRLDPEGIDIAISTSTFDILSRRVIGYESSSLDVESTVDTIADGIRRCAKAADIDVSSLAGIGVAVHGMVDPVLGIIEGMTNRSEWGQVPIARMLEERLSLPVVADNCVRAGAIAYERFNSQHHNGNTLYMAVAEGIGAAILYNGDVVPGLHHSGNQLGHIIIDPRGPQCACGKQGCLEAFSSDIALVHNVWPEAVKHAKDLNIEEREALVQQAFNLAMGGDVKARQALGDVITHLGIGIANGVALFSPRTVVVCGTLIDVASSWTIEEIRKAVIRLIPQSDRGIEIRAAVNYKDFMLRGAIGLVLAEPYRVPRENRRSGELWHDAATAAHADLV